MDLSQNKGWVSVGINHDATRFCGRNDSPLVEHGMVDSNSVGIKSWKTKTQRFGNNKVSFSRVFLLILVIIVGLYYYWPKISNLNILSPKEQEVHGYLKEIIPVVRSTLQKFKQLDEDPANATFAADLGNLSGEILTINENYWETGNRTETFVRILINKVRGRKEKEISFLVHWRGPEKERESLDDLRMDTRTLMYRAWGIKEDSNKLAKVLKNMLRKWELKGKNSTQEARPLIEEARPLIVTSWRILGDTDQVHRRWKGNFRLPFSFSS